MKKLKKELLFISLLTFIIILSIITIYQSSLGKYRSITTTQTNLNVVQWKIIINDNDILRKKTITENFEILIEPDMYIKDGTTAPGSKGYFDVTIDSTETTLPFNLEAEATVLDPEEDPDFKFTKYILDEVETEISNPEAILLLNKTVQPETNGNENITTIKYYIEWLDKDSDTEHSKNRTVIPVRVNLNLRQINQ